MLTLATGWGHVCQVFSTEKLSYFSPFHSVLLGEREDVCPPPPWWGIYIKYMEFFCMGDLPFLPYLFIQLFTYIRMDSCMLKAFFFPSKWPSVSRWELFQLAPESFDITHHCGFYFLKVSPYFLALSEALGSSCTLVPWSQNQPFLPGVLVPVRKEWN